jgi:arabinogalactan oligomer/maltooligosaccharide transport system substrate-binding protein
MRRNALLGIAPARSDAAAAAGGLAETVNDNLAKGNIAVMPSVRAVAQMWTPAQTFFADVAKDPFRSAGAVKYATLTALKEGLQKVDRQIYDAIHTLQ